METNNNRITFCDIVVGAVGSGKTHFLEKEILPKMIESGKRVLVVTEQRDDWQDYPLLQNYDELKTFTGGRKMYFADGRLEKIKEFYMNGILVFDDARTFINSQPTKFLRWLLIGRRHEGIDLFSVFHGLDEVPPIYFKFSSRLIMFNSTGELAKRKQEISAEKINLIAEAKKQLEDDVRSGKKYTKRCIILDESHNF